MVSPLLVDVNVDVESSIWIFHDCSLESLERNFRNVFTVIILVESGGNGPALNPGANIAQAGFFLSKSRALTASAMLKGHVSKWLWTCSFQEVFDGGILMSEDNTELSWISNIVAGTTKLPRIRIGQYRRKGEGLFR